ncbi:MAG: BrnT family toxin [Thermomicrobiales bacterium]
MTHWEESPEIERLDWDEWNSEHLAKHGVTREEVEDAIKADTVARATYKERFLVLGPTRAGRILAVVIGPVPGQPGAFYTFSARPASRTERRHYHDHDAKGSDER